MITWAVRQGRIGISPSAYAPNLIIIKTEEGETTENYSTVRIVITKKEAQKIIAQLQKLIGVEEKCGG